MEGPGLAHDVMLGCPLRCAGNKADGHCSDASDDEHLCMLCGVIFPSAAGVHCHAGHVHGLGVSTAVKPLLAGSICPGCGIDFRTRIRFAEHLRPTGWIANDCRRHVLSGAVPRLDPSALAALDEGDRLLRKACREAGISTLASDGFACRASTA